MPVFNVMEAPAAPQNELKQSAILETIYPLVPDEEAFEQSNGKCPDAPKDPSLIWLVAEPMLEKLNVYTAPDPTYGRYLLPAQREESYTIEHPSVLTTRRRVFTTPSPNQPSAEYVELTEEEIVSGRGRNWIFWQSWEAKDRKGLVGEGIDIMCIHGIGQYGGVWSSHMSKFVSNGFRVIAPDLPGHGHSSDVHCYIESLDQLNSSIRAVFDDKAESDAAAGRPPPRKTFISGSSLGAFVILKYLEAYPQEKEENPSIDGCYLTCPLIDVSMESRPSKLATAIGYTLEPFAGRIPVAKAQRGNGHEDPRVEIAHMLNPQAYHGALRVSTGLTLMRGLLTLDVVPPKLHLSDGFRVVHGKDDKITSPQATINFFKDVENATVDLWDGYGHVMYKTGWDEEDDKPRQKILNDGYDWICSKVK